MPQANLLLTEQQVYTYKTV